MSLENPQPPNVEILAVISKYSQVDRITAVSSWDQYATKSREYGYTVLGRADTNFIGEVKHDLTSPKYNLKTIHGRTLPVDIGIKWPIVATILAQNKQGLHKLYEWESQYKKEKNSRMVSIDD